MAGFERNLEQNLNFIKKSVTNVDIVLRLLQQRDIEFKLSSTDDKSEILEEVVRTVISKKEFAALIKVFHDTGNKEAAEKISDLTSKEFEEFIGAETTKVPSATAVKEKSERELSMEVEITRLKKQIDHLSKVQQGVRQEIDDKVNKLKELQKYKNQHDQLNDKLKVVTKEKEYREKTISQLKKEIENLKMDLEKKNKELNDKIQQLDDSQRRVDLQESRHRTVVQEIQQQNKNIEELKNEFKNDMEELRKDLKKEKKENKDNSEELKKGNAKILSILESTRPQQPIKSMRPQQPINPQHRFQSTNIRQQKKTNPVQKSVQPGSKK